MTGTPEARRFTKQVAIKELDHDERTATGAVLVPWEVDRQGDWLRPEGVEAMYNPDPEDGVLHARFPDDAAELVENTIADEPIELNGKEYPAGTWYATRQYHDEDLWSLVADGIFTGFSIGGEVSDEDVTVTSELPDEVSFPEEVSAGDFATVTEITNGYVEEVSDVDIPAVPRAVYTTAKSLEKNLVDDVSGREEFIELFQERGHSEEDAARVWEYVDGLSKAAGADRASAMKTLVDAAGSADRGASSPTERHDMTNKSDRSGTDGLDDEDVGFVKRLRKSVSGIGGSSEDPVDLLKSIDPAELDSAGPTIAKAAALAKEGRTLNQTNRETLMAAHDAIEATLSADLDHEWNRFTDDARYSFDLTQFADPATDSDKAADVDDATGLEKLSDQQGELAADALTTFTENQGDATFGDLREWRWSVAPEELDDETAFALDRALDEYQQFRRNQRDSLSVSDEFAAWIDAEANTNLTSMTDLTQTIDDLSKQVEELEKRIDDVADDGDSTDKSADGDVDDDDAAAKLDDLSKQLEEMEDRLDKVSKATAESSQIDTSPSETEKDADKRSAIETEKSVFTY